MSRLIISLVLTLLGLRAVGQTWLPVDASVDLNTGHRNVFTLSGQFDYNANTLLNELPLAIYRGGYLQRDLRQRSADALREKGNSAGYVIEGSLQWTGAACWSSKPDWRPVIKLGHHDLAGVSFTADQFNLTFFGNAAYEGRTAVLAPWAFEQVRYQAIGGGIVNGTNGSYLRLDILRGRSFAAVDAEWASLYTGEDGRVLRSALLGEYVASDTAGSGIDRANGLGGAVSARWAFITGGERQIRIGLGVEHLGFIAWNKNTVSISKDTLIRYEGWQVDDLFALDDVLVNEETVLDTFGLRYEHAPAVRMAPFHLRADAAMAINTDWQVGLSAEHRHLPGYIPLITAFATRVIGTRTMVGATLGYGGFGSLRLGVAAKRRFGERVLVSLSTPQLPAFATGRVSGLGLMFACSVGF